MLQSTITLRDVQNHKSTVQLAHDVMLGQLRGRIGEGLVDAGELALKGLLNSFGAGPRDYDRRDANIREQAALYDQMQALTREGQVHGYQLALACFERHAPDFRESFDTYARRLDAEIRKEQLIQSKKAGELALHAIAFSASHPEYGPARAAAVRASGTVDGLREGMCIGLDMLQDILKRDEEAQAAKNDQ